jgi:hypothetical protein
VSSEILITRDGQEVRKLTEEVADVAGAAAQMNFVKKIAMNEFEPGEYAIQVKITDNLSQTPLVMTDRFTVR